ncbi:hypothetical protein ACFLS1_01725 [Verrucomicrobiota bacterium]
MSDSKEVFNLRKTGKLDDALALSRSLISRDSLDIWNIRAHGWVLSDAIKAALHGNERETAGKLLGEFKDLSIPDDEDKLLAALEYYSNRLNPDLDILEQARKVGQSGDNEKALGLYRSAIKKLPDEQDAHTGLGWELQRRIKTLMAAENANMDQVRNCLHEYATLQIPKPGPLHSIMLAYATRRAEKFSKYVEFVRWWDLKHLQPEDFEKQVVAETDKTYPSLVERVIKALYKSLKSQVKPDDLPWV